MTRLKVLSIFGARPEAIKMAPVVKELERHPGKIASRVCVTAPHRNPSSNPQLTRYIDPKRNEDDRRWHPHTIDLSGYAGQTVTITFETGVGPAGDERFDWAGWGAFRLSVSSGITFLDD